MQRDSIGKLILVPAVITLGVTLLRLVGELNQWSPRFFNREAGGGGALVGIVWLIFLFGVYFAIVLRRTGRGPASTGRAIGFALLGMAVFAGLTAVVARVVPGMAVRLVLVNLASVLGAAIAYRGWPELGKTNLAYGLAARIPVAVLMLIAMAAQWGTHYELGPPGFPEMGLLPKWFFIGLLPQLVVWVSITVMVGGLLGSLALLVARSGATPATRAA